MALAVLIRTTCETGAVTADVPEATVPLAGGRAVTARIDPAAKTWYGAVRIPFSALVGETPHAGQEFRIKPYFAAKGHCPIGFTSYGGLL
jgi:hypothetical protein